MTHFDELQPKAKKISMSLAEKYSNQIGCLTFFSALVHSSEEIFEAADVIALLASSLEEHYDKDLKDYFGNLISDYAAFKEQVLIGIYLVKWVQYNTLLDSYINKSLIDLFRSHLGIQSLEVMDKARFNLCLHSLSRYCSYVYYNDQKGLNYSLKALLGNEIQLHIHKAYKVSANDTYSGITESLGMQI